MRLCHLIFCLTFSFLLASCGVEDAGQIREKTLVIGKASALSTIDPGITVVAQNFAPLALAYERLLRFVVVDGVPTGEVEGELAESWTTEDNGKIWTFRLRADHKFDDGSPVTADAVRFSFLRTLHLGLGTAQALSGLLDVEALDRRTVRFRLAASSPIFPLILALPPMVVINPTVLRHEQNKDQASAWLSEHTAGSGPYQVTQWERGQRITLKPNPYAANPPEFFQKIVIKVIKDDASRRLQLARGDIDIFENISPDTVHKLAQIPGVTIFERPTPLIIALAMNTERKPFNDPRVRQAISRAIDRAAIVKGVMQSHASLMHGVLPQGIPGYDPTLSIPKRDVSAASHLLTEAGIKPGKSFTLSYIPISVSTEAIALATQSQLAAVGIEIKLEALAPSAFAKVLSGDFDITLSSWFADFPDPWPLMQFAYYSKNAGEGYNLSRYSRAEVDELLLKAESAMDTVKRLSYYQKVQNIVMSDSPMVPLFEAHGLLAYRSDLKGLQYNAWQPGLYNVQHMYRER